MLGLLKKIYKSIPTRISYPIIKYCKLAPVFSNTHWEKVERIAGFENNFERDEVNKNLNRLAAQIKDLGFYNSSEYLNFIKKPNLSHLKKLPYTDSETVRKNFNRIVDKNIKGYLTSTGGTGGSPLKLYLSDESYYKDREYVFFAWSQLGYSKGDKKLTLRGVNLGNELTSINPMNNELNVNLFLMNEENLPAILDAVNDFNPVFGHGYPSAWYNFANLLKNNAQEFNCDLKGIYYASETVNPQQREFVQDFFKAPVRSTYSSSERAFFAYETLENENVYQILPGYGLIEILDQNGDDQKVGKMGEVVCTGFINKAMPLIRYKTGDFATVEEKQNGIVSKIRDVKGRWGKDFILDKEGNKIFTTSINIHSEEQFDFKYIQLNQSEKGKLLIKLVPFEGYSNSQIEIISEEFSEKLPSIQVEVEVVDVDDVYKTHRGKVPYLVKSI